MSKNTYLADIDGLRAISVLAVIIFHFLPHSAGAGYLGVDAFFVISGFVISASLASYPTPSGMREFLARFYLRRIRRLFPALVFVVLLISLLTVLLTSRSEVSLKTGAFSIIGLANFYLYREASDYFGLASELNLFTHMWSLAVEDQFYILFPILIWFLGNRAAPVLNAVRLFRPLLIIVSISFFSFLALIPFDYPFAFYMMPTRLWQIGLGALIYILMSTGKVGDWLPSLPVEIPVTGMLLVLLFGDYIPVASHVLIALFTAFALGIVGGRNRNSPILTCPPVAYIGKISYSLYLWHWPIIVLAKHTFGITSFSIVICLVLTFALAIFSYHFVEAPFRFGKPIPQENKLIFQFRKMLAVSIAIFVFLLAVFPKFVISYNNLLAKTFNVPPVPAQFSHRCHGKARIATFDNPLEECLGGKRTREKSRKLYLLGDSHANHIVPMIKMQIDKTPFAVKFANFESRKYGIWALTQSAVSIPQDIQYILDDALAGDMIIVSFHRGILNRQRDMHLSLGEAVSLNEKSQNLIKNLIAVLGQLQSQNVGIILALDTPLMASITTSETCAFQIQFSGESVCKITRNQDLHTRKRQATAFAILKEQLTKIEIWDPAVTIYSDSDTFDVLDAEGNYSMSDWNHVTDKTLERLAPDFQKVFERAVAKTGT